MSCVGLSAICNLRSTNRPTLHVTRAASVAADSVHSPSLFLWCGVLAFCSPVLNSRVPRVGSFSSIERHFPVSFAVVDWHFCSHRVLR